MLNVSVLFTSPRINLLLNVLVLSLGTQANYRAVIRVHKASLSALKGFWQLLLHSDVSMTRLQARVEAIRRWWPASETTCLPVVPPSQADCAQRELHQADLCICITPLLPAAAQLSED